MIDKGHCRINVCLHLGSSSPFSCALASSTDSESWEDSEYAPFYDYYATDDEEEEKEESVCTDSVAYSSFCTSGRVSAVPYIAEDESEMILPSGMAIGNRAYKIYYKQYLPVRYEHESFAIKRLNEFYKSLGQNQNGLPSKSALNSQRRQAQDNAKNAMDIGVRHSGLQSNFRAQIL